MMRTLTHEPLALAAVLLLLVAIAACLSVWVTLRIQTRSGRKARPAGAGTERVDSPLGAAGPGVVSMRLPTPGPDTKTRPSAMGGGKSAGYARLDPAAEAKGRAIPEAADMAPEGAPAALSGATPTVARAALTPDCPSLDAEFWRANPLEPLSPSELVRWNTITERYEWVAPTVVVPGRES